jgi:hypothetical protein
MEKFIVRGMNGQCQNEPVSGNGNDPTPPPPGIGGITITAPVGNASPNRQEDVRTIQAALNRIPPEQGGPRVPLKVDSLCGPRTKDVIQVFQVKQFGWKYADMKVEPGKQTIARLNELTGGSVSGPPLPTVDVTVVDTGAEEAFKQLMGEHLARARKCIKAAQFDITRALPMVDQPDGGPIPQLSRKKLLERINRHFDIDHARNRRNALESLLSVFDNMEKVFQRPGGMWGEKAFVLYKGELHKTRVGFTFSGGFYYPGVVSPINKLRYDTIYLTAGLAPVIAGKAHSGAGTILHELAHFCGGQQNFGHIGDFAYGNLDHPKVRRLSPEQKLRNADCYANYAIEVGTGSAAYYLWS